MELQNCGEKDQTKNVNAPMEQEQSPLQQNLEEKGDFQRIFFIHLLFSEKPQRPPIETVHAALRKAFGQVDIVCSKGLWSFALKKYPVDFSDVKQVPAQILLTEEMPSGTEKLGFMERSQLWNIPDGEALLDRCPWKVMLSDFMSSLLSYQERSQMLLEWLQVAMDLFPSCLGVWVPSAGKLHTAQQVRDILAEKQDPFIRLAVNARFFRIQGTQDNVFYPQLGVKLCSMVGGGVQKIYMVFLREPSRRDRSGSDLFHLRDGFEIKMNFDRNAVSYTHLDVYKRQSNGNHGPWRHILQSHCGPHRGWCTTNCDTRLASDTSLPGS